jgi:hypothetical protein
MTSSNTTKLSVTMDFNRLPNELLLEISYVSPFKSLLSLRAVNRRFHQVFSDEFYETFVIPASEMEEYSISENLAALSIRNDWTSALEQLLAKGLDANATINNPINKLCSLLHLAVISYGARSKGNTDIARLLLKNGAYVSGTEEDYLTGNQLDFVRLGHNAEMKYLSWYELGMLEEFNTTVKGKYNTGWNPL